MGLGLREIGKMRAIGRFIVTQEAAPEDIGHLPAVPVANDAPWIQVVGSASLRPNLAILLPASGRYCPPEMHFAMATLQMPPGCQCLYIGLKGVRRDLARIEMVKQAINAGAEFAVMFDDDNPPPSDAIVKMLEVFHREDDSLAVVGGIYVGKCLPTVPWVFKFTPENPEGFYWQWKAGQVFECDAIASGCMMIRLSVLRSLPEPWFLEVHSVEEAIAAQPFADAAPRGYYVEVTDDMYFCHKLRAAGFRIMAHGGILPGHWASDGTCYRLDPDSYPMREGE